MQLCDSSRGRGVSLTNDGRDPFTRANPTTTFTGGDATTASTSGSICICALYGLVMNIDELKNTEEELRRSETKLRQIVDTVPAFIWSASPEGRPSLFQ